MKVSIHSRTKILVIVAVLLIAAVVAALLLRAQQNKPAVDTNSSSSGDGSSVVIDNPKPNPNDQPPIDNKPPQSEPACDEPKPVIAKFILTASASVYTTALDAKNKTNPALTYQPGEYFIYKCLDEIINITRTHGVPGGWIDSTNPYVKPAPIIFAPDEIPPKVPTIDVMTIDNTIVNWSHEYPAAFVRDYNGFWNISPNRLYLTFDCGYDYNNLTATIMDTLRSRGVKAVFFVTGDFMNDRPDLVRRMVNEGHIIGNHSYAHLNQPLNLVAATDAVVSDIRTWEAKYRSIAGSNPSALYFRPPEGAISRRSMALMNQLGYKTLMWGAAYRDWDTSAQLTQDVAMTLLRKYTTPGDIVLLHGVSQTSSDMLGGYIDEYRGKGFTFSLP